MGEVYRLIKNGDLIRYVHGIPNHLTFSGSPKKNTPKKQNKRWWGRWRRREREREGIEKKNESGKEEGAQGNRTAKRFS